jgi:N-acetylglutamate synthase
MIDMAREAEERLVNVWPAVATLIMDGWAVRFAHGYSGRANSASAIVPDAMMTAALAGQIEELYAQAGQRPQFRLTPVAHASVQALLMARGYRVKDQAATMSTALQPSSGADDARITMEPKPSTAWLEGISALQTDASKKSPAHLNAIVGAIRLPAAFASIGNSGYGVCVIDRGWAEIGSVAIDPLKRGKGLGRALMTSLMRWAAERGASTCFLQVDKSNAAALGLYEKLGFIPIYDYRTLILDAK